MTGGRITAVTVRDDKGGKVSGAMRPDGTSWVPAGPLRHRQGYTAEVVASNDSGQSTTQTTRFSTMAKPAGRIVSMLSLESGRTYGVAMPVTVSFDPGIPEKSRADVERRLFVSTDPPQPGVWHWTENGRQVSYRAPDFWQQGTTINVRSALDGLPIAKSHGDLDRTVSARIGGRLELDIDNRTKQMSVFKDGQLVRKIPVSLGKARTPTSSGKMVIMEKHASTVFDTRREDPDGGYVVRVSDAQRLTWGGEFIHAAPWSVGDQGYANVSHGCTNVSSENAAWLMDVTQVGDLVTISGTEERLQSGNGWTAWDLSWAEYVKGSALPIPAALQPALPSPAPPNPTLPGAAPAGSGSPSPRLTPDSAPSVGVGG